jgi:predicted ribosome-associated RNA-binding protein Tma20
VEFKTTNYDITTTSEKEYEIAVGLRECPEEDMKDNERKNVIRKKRIVKDLVQERIAVDAGLGYWEVLTVVSVRV